MFHCPHIERSFPDEVAVEDLLKVLGRRCNIEAVLRIKVPGDALPSPKKERQVYSVNAEKNRVGVFMTLSTPATRITSRC